MLLIENNFGELLVYKEYRHGISDVTYTFPAGGIEGNESIEETTKEKLWRNLDIFLITTS